MTAKKNGIVVLQVKLTTTEHRNISKAKETYREAQGLQKLSWPEFLGILLETFEKHRRQR